MPLMTKMGGLILCEWHLQGYDTMYSYCVYFILPGAGIIVTSRMLLWSFLCNLRDMMSSM
jgi:hypothetical protein